MFNYAQTTVKKITFFGVCFLLEKSGNICTLVEGGSNEK